MEESKPPYTCIGLAIGAALVIYVVLLLVFAPWNYTESLQLAELQSKALGASTTWYEKIVVKSSAPEVTVYYFNDELPEIGSSTYDARALSNFTLLPNAYKWWGYYFNEQSVLEVSYTTFNSQPVWFGIIRGQTSLDRWLAGKNDVDTIYQQMGSSLPYYKFTVAEADDYFVVLENLNNFNTVAGSIYEEIEYTTFNFSQAQRQCDFKDSGSSSSAATSACEYSLKFSSDDRVVVAAGLTASPDTVFDIEVEYTGRAGFYWGVLFCLVVGVCVVLALICGALWYLHFRKRASYDSF